MQRRPFPRTLSIIVLFLRPVLMVITKRDWQGQERLPDGGFVLAPNHLSHLDPFLISHFMVDQGIPPRFLVKDTLMSLPVAGRILRSAQQIPVYRSSEGAGESLRAAIAAVEAGSVVTIYPEGTITRDPAAWPMSGRTGAVRVALATGRPLVPVMQWGPQEILWPYTKRPRFFPRKTIHVRVGEPLDLSDLAGRELTEQVLHEATDRLMDGLTAMMAQVRAELPSTPRIDVHTLGRPKTNYRRSDQ
ncbi:lysophospholipid acyltransferase family protein [Aeromicrobium wangtongii]|uniref:lysophospholipid acyltransferase family protein n=1 Tax=Aeromicrobium wangtongii TaxID=2969247 RepID=UPI002016EA48|nr:lysophospholipid acyltransferase family protein [Aeromicrobium wangtongii]MCL3818297.1 1-acyl-sn-glycerol-3-phosphate acyltransferase [Aeromicrobium wangtongii]